jgi:SAM-dependent methyltransferase
MSLRDTFYNVYDKICGKLPHCNIFHFCWLSTRIIQKDLRRVLPTITGKVLDIGCGDKPYKNWTNAEEYVGLDVYDSPEIDIVVNINEKWNLADESFDCVISTQSLEHISGFDVFFQEISRVLKPQGKFLITMPFIQNEHATPYDFRRFSYYGIQEILKDDYNIIEIKKQGGFGSMMGFMFLSFIFSFKSLRFFFSILFPLWILLSFFVNICGVIIDKIDSTGYFYPNIFVIAEKK